MDRLDLRCEEGGTSQEEKEEERGSIIVVKSEPHGLSEKGHD